MFFESGTTRRRFHAANIQRLYMWDIHVRMRERASHVGGRVGKGDCFIESGYVGFVEVDWVL